ncbi:YeeE/YedE family protein [Rubellimicrobium roseum]|uniref:YeeE/YedE family protein n=1 Tax=Rubellimicrobium roseum TaxID=687525 RepID=A0A5C4N926_9RHOB|nr:YeeE/YedE family protein [Rubellimicrobium roseum]
MTPTDVTLFASLVGGTLIGLSAVLLMAFLGRIAGISGIGVRLLPPYLDSNTRGRVAFILGLIAAPSAWLLATGVQPQVTLESSAPLLLFAGLLVGFGSVWGAGCTSGHGVCGLSRLSARSFVAVGTFMTTAIVTVFFARHVF